MKKRRRILRLAALCAAVVLAGNLGACQGTGAEGTGDDTEAARAVQKEDADKSTVQEEYAKADASKESSSEKEANGEADAGNDEQTQAPEADVDELSELLARETGEMISFEKNTYYSGDRFALWIEKGAVLPRDVADRIKEVMEKEEALYGLSYDDHLFAENATARDFFFGDGFRGIPYPEDKVNVMIRVYKNDGAVEWADTNEVVFFDEDFDPEKSSGEVFYHEMAHVLRLRQSPNLGSVLEEGIGNYAEWRIALELGTPCWEMIQYVDDDTYLITFDPSAMLEDPEKAFREYTLADRSSSQNEYHYGTRFVAFLMEEYGTDVIARLSEAAAKRQFTWQDVDVIEEILRETTSEDVFERFGAWLPEGWRRCSREILDSLIPFGL